MVRVELNCTTMNGSMIWSKYETNSAIEAQSKSYQSG